MINVKEKFLELTSRTYPHGTENELFHLLPKNLKTDEFGNKYIKIGKKTSTMFTCHLDTATSANTKVNHVIEGNIIKTDGSSILGADDKAGCVIMLYMIEHKVPGLYYFFLGEEVGCVGSKKLSDKFKTNKLKYIQKVISFDRRSTDSIITFQASSRCCSEEFATALGNDLNECSKHIIDNNTVFNYKNDPTGVYTDSAQFTSIYPECTNISVGYYSEHTFTERQDIKHLDALAKACCLVDWENLPVKRDPSVKEYRSYSYGSYNGGYTRSYDDDDYYYNYYSSYNRNNRPKEEKKFFVDRSFTKSYYSSITIEKETNKIKAVDFSVERLAFEKSLIEEFLFNLEIFYKNLNWTGEKGIIVYENNHMFKEVTRDELSEFLPELNFWKFEINRSDKVDFFDEDYFAC